ncbi:Dynein heavy chain family protein [Tritrichomonas foetus]|uniref:Dynein heavy chain family protein n=1 Tax=Tritrichomonas foetus TaxID=1144522 RepID=A0A1J4KYP9_9EUKA|nr:Dynein heavy chain family protein [Tritrichomonas foetus]|eukprot:OHT16379.1 Dynein heavy chain family protein [Tritrichomonas foetus]
MSEENPLQNRLYCKANKKPVVLSTNIGRRRPVVPGLNIQNKIEVAPPPATTRPDKNPRHIAKIPTCRVQEPDQEEIPATARQGTKSAPSWTSRITNDFAEWKENKLYTKYISETEWRDRNLPFWFIWQFTALDLKNEFVYLDYADIPTPNTYCLVPILPTQVDKNSYFTLSLDGLTYFKDGAGSFLPIEQWMREIILYRRVGEVNFFKKFLSIYAFRSLWRSAISRKSSISSNVVEKKYFLANNHFKIVGNEIRKIALELSKITLVDLKFNYPHTLDQFLDKQATHIEKLRETFREIHARAQDILVAACEAAYSASQDIGSSAEASNSLDYFMTQYQRKNKGKGNKRSNKHEPVVNEGDEHHYTRLAAIRSCCKRITKFIRLCDIQFMQALLQCVRHSAAQLVQFFLTEPPAAALAVDYIIDKFNPTPEFYVSQVTKAWNELSDTTTIFDRFLYSQAFSIYTKESLLKLDKIREIELTQKFKDIVAMDSIYQNTISQLEPNILSVFQELDGLTEQLNPYIEILNQSKELKMEFTDDSAQFFQTLIQDLKGQLDVVDQMPQILEHRLVEIQLSKMKSLITPAPRGSLDKLRSHVPFLCLTKAQALDEKIEKITDLLSQECTTVFQFGDQIEMYVTISNEMQDFRNEYHAVSELHIMLEQEAFPLPLELTDLVRGLSPKYSNFESLFNKIGEGKEANNRKWGEQLKKDIGKLSEEITESNFKLDKLTDDVEESLKVILEIDVDGQRYQHDLEKYQAIQRLIGQKQTEVDGLNIFLTELKNKKTLFQCSHDWDIARKTIMSSQLHEIVAHEFTQSIDKFKQTADFCGRVFKESKLAQDLKQNVTEFSQLAPVIATLRTPSLKERHWSRIERMLNQEGLQAGNIKIQTLVDMGAANYSEEFATIAIEAENEDTLEQMIKDIMVQWWDIYFQVIPTADNPNLFVVSGIQDITDALDESLVKCSTIRASRYVGPHKPAVDKLMVSLNRVGKVIELITSVQKQWLYLMNIFKDADIQRQLASEFKSFHDIDREYREWVRIIRDQPRVYQIAAQNEEGIKALTSWDKRLEAIQKALEIFLMGKRTQFPRFFFLSNDDLIEILSLGKDPVGLQKHLNKLFENIYGLRLADNGHAVDAMVSKEGEVVAIQPVAIRGPIEGWLKTLESQMKRSLQAIAADAFACFESMPYDEWTASFPGQLVIAISQVFFTQLVHDHVVGHLDHVIEVYAKRLETLATIVRGDLNPVYREVLVALITVEVHSRDIVQELIDNGCQDGDDYEWTKRLRYYFEDSKLVIKQHDADIEYGNEYLGATTRLIITPLTERCYLTLTNAVHLHLGGSPSGPAGTGKTETVKDLAKALANFCVVFNCSEAVTANQMQSFFSGLAQTGAWSCFDEFNRIDPGVLSVIAEQVRTIQDALNANAENFIFCGKNIPLIPRCGVFITMNPGYAGRTELPDNLKALFRPIAMMVPDYALIAEIFLYGQGFVDARNLAEKMTQLYKLSSEMLSPQSHYDFGMRALKSVLSMAGRVKRLMPDASESEILIQAMNNSNIPKLIGNDKILFQSLVTDLFPQIEFETKLDMDLMDKINKTLIDNGKSAIEPLVIKTLQLHETMIIRHGVMLVGPTGGGKSTSMKALATVVDADVMTLNPKSIELSKMYGSFNEATGEWADGIVSKMFRECLACETKQQKWIVFDGPVDALWIENMNTVLDDNKMLSLANSQRLKMTDEMHLVFEVGDLTQASPATVSRCGMVYYEPSDLPWKAFMDSWFLRYEIRDEGKEVLTALLEDVMPKVIPLKSVVCISTGFESLAVFVDAMIKSYPEMKEDIPDAYIKKLKQIFVWSFAWAFGGGLATKKRQDFDGIIRDSFEAKSIYPTRRTIFDYFLDKDAMTFTPWSDVSNAAPPDENFVATEDSVAFNFITDLLVTNKRHAMVVGPSGSGKSIIIQNMLAAKADSLYTLSLTLSAQTTAIQFQETIETKMESKSKKLLGPPEGKSAVFIVDDIIMPKPEQYGAQPPLEVLRQYMGYGGFYNRKELTWIEVKDLTIISACQPPGGGRNKLSPRLLSQFTQLYLSEPSESSLNTIFKTILDVYFKRVKYPDPVVGLAPKLVNASVTLFEKVCQEFLPTPSRSHYTFNLRDLARVFVGVRSSRPEVIYAPETLIDLWEHENFRIYHDRLIDVQDRNAYIELISGLRKKFFQVDETEDRVRPVFADFVTHDGYYRPVDQLPKLRKVLQDFFDEHWASKRLVFFDDAILHISRVVRVLKQPLGNMMLVGVGGTGKRTTARAASMLAGYEVAEPKLTNRYTRTEFRDDLKELYIKCGVEGKNISFLIADEHIIDESFLEDINCILNSGEVPNLFDNDETEKIINDISPLIKKLNLSFARDSILSFFINRVKSNLHIILALSPIGSKFRTRCQMFPSLVNCCTIDWFDIWSNDALMDVALSQIGEIDFEGMPVVDNVVEKLSKLAKEAHINVTEQAEEMKNELRRAYYVTPAAYIDFMRTLGDNLGKRQRKLNEEQAMLQKGLMKLEETNNVVNDMEKELTALRPVLQQKAEEGAKLLEELSARSVVMEDAKKAVEEEKVIVQANANDAQKLSNEAKAELDAALPTLKAAIDAVEVLKTKKGELSAVKTYKNPPPRVRLTMSAVCTLYGLPTDWKGGQAFLSKPSMMSDLADLHNQGVSEERLSKLQKILQDPEFTVEKVAEQSEAASCLCRWVINIDKYIRVKHAIAPLQKRVEEANAAYAEAKAKLDAKLAELKELETKFNELKATHQKCLDEQAELQKKIEKTQYRLENASKLTTALSSEHTRWSASLEELTALSANIVGDTFLIALYLSYIGPFPQKYRSVLLEKFMASLKREEIPFTEGFNLENAAGDPMEIRQWRIAGLPSDSLSTENGILVTSNSRWPLLIDPQEQGFRWFCAVNEENGLQILRPGEPKINQTIENAIKMGTPILIEGVGETIDPSLKSILTPQIRKTPAGTLKMTIDGREIDYDPKFRLVLVTKHNNPQFLPDVFIQLSVINFAVTPSGLVEQLLTDVVKYERPEVEEARAKLVVEIAEMKKTLDLQMKKILNLLFKSEGNILDNEALITTLQEAKATASEVSTRLAEAEVTEKKNAELCDIYRGVSTRGSTLFFTLPDLPSVDPMYQYSLEFFKSTFISCIQQAPPSDDINVRLQSLIDLITYRTYCSVSRGLFSRHQIFYSFILVTSIMRSEGTLSEEEWNLFVRGPAKLPPAEEVNPPDSSIDELTWRKIVAVSSVFKPLEPLASDIQRNFDDWQEYLVSERSTQVPAQYSKLSNFQRLMLISLTCHRKLLIATREFIVAEYGEKFAAPPDLSLSSAFVDTKVNIPLVFILSQGADPLPSLRAFAEKNEAKLHPLSLGQGQGPIAVELIKDAKNTGDWVFLQNCHLYTSWLGVLSDILREIRNKPREVNQNFRLFLSSMPTPEFPFSILQESTKVTSEPPRGLALNVTRLLTNIIDPSTFDSQPLSQRFILALAFFASLIQERKKFGPLGWNIIYEWSDSDFRVSTLQLRSLLKLSGDVQWKALTHLVGHIAFGGRVTDDWDRRTLLSHLQKILCPEILQDGFAFDEQKLFSVPEQRGFQNMLSHIAGYPTDDSPDVFGLHLNAQMAAQMSSAKDFINSVQNVQPRVSGSASAQKTDDIVKDMADKMHAECPPNLVYTEPEVETSLHVVLRQEILRYNRLLQVVRESSANLVDAVNGLVVMSDSLQEMYIAFVNGKVPELWANAAYPCMKPLISWFADLVQRVQFIRTWATKGEPAIFWIGGFFFPQSFMTGILQNYSRKHLVPVNKLRFKTETLKDPVEKISKAPEDGVYIYGMYFDGADWDYDTMTLKDPKVGTSYAPCPVIHLLPCEGFVPKQEDYLCPCYRTQIRAGILASTGLSTNFVVSVQLKVKESPQFWTLRGAAILLGTPN